MANALDETTAVENKEGRDAFVIQKQVEADKATSANVLEVICWILFIIPGIIWFVKKKKALSTLRAMEQRIQTQDSQIDNYMEQRVVILQNAAKLLDKAVNLDKEVLTSVAAYRGGRNPQADNERNEVASKLDGIQRNIQIAFEAYPNIQAHNEIADCLQQNSYLQKEITAARDLYNDAVNQWNAKIFEWPIYLQVAYKNKFTTRIPFTTTAEMKEKARGTFF